MGRIVSGDGGLDEMLSLWSERCRDESGLADLTDAERKSAEAAYEADSEGASLVDIAVRPRPDGDAEVEVLIENNEGELEGALQWLSVVEEDGEWRLDECEARARFRRIGESIEASPRTPPITAADEVAVARWIEARYLGTGPAEELWEALSTRCRDVEWDGSLEAFRAQHAAIGKRMSKDPVAFSIDQVDLVSTLDDMAHADIVATRDGYTIDTSVSGQAFDYLYEDARWRHDDCSEAAEGN